MKLEMLAKDTNAGIRAVTTATLATTSIRTFLAGHTPPPHSGKQEWMALVRAANRVGRLMQRVHVVTEPLTDYVRFEVAWSYAHSVSAGEDVRLIPVVEGEAWPRDVALSDFWLFDDTELFTMRYDAAGMWLGVAHVTDRSAVQIACQQRDVAWRLAQPWISYVNERPELARRVPATQ